MNNKTEKSKFNFTARLALMLVTVALGEGSENMNRIGNHSIFFDIRNQNRNKQKRQSSGWRRLICSLCVIYALLLTTLISAPPTALAQSGPRPGKDDPAGKNILFPSHDVGLIIPSYFGNKLEPFIYKSDQNLNLTTDFFYDQPLDADNIVAAAGHIWSPSNEQMVYARRPNGGSELHIVFAYNLRYDPPIYPETSYVFSDFAPRLSDSADFMAIAAGDLDSVPDSAGNNHDEVVVAYATNASPGSNEVSVLKVAVLDYTAPASAPPLPVAVTTSIANVGLAPNNNFATAINQDAILPVDNVLGVAIGDFNNNGQKEIAVVHLGDYQAMWISIFRYTNDGQGNRSLQVVSTTPTSAEHRWVGSVSVAAGNFDGKGGDELLIGGAEWKDNSNSVDQYVGLYLWQADVNLNLTRRALYSLPSYRVQGQPGGTQPVRFDNLGGRVRLQVAPGLFKYDPQNGFDLNRRQFAAGWNLGTAGGGEGGMALMTFEVSDDLSTINIINQRYNPGEIYQRFSMAVGAFKGNSTTTPPLWAIALGYWSADGNYYCQTINSNLDTANVYRFGTPGDPGGGFQRYPLVPVDNQGKSVYLGPPIHFTIDGAVNTDFVMQEPPKHAFYDNRPTINVNGHQVKNPTYGQVITVSRYDQTNVALKTSRGESFSGTSKDSSDWSIGGSTEISAGASVNAGFAPIGKVDISLESTTKVGYDYNQKKESYNSNYQSRTVTQTEQTDHDDKMLGRLQTYDVWRYRVYGVPATDPQGNPTNPFYEIVLPGPSIPFNGGGLNFDWYQPTYENGNILSYPQWSDTYSPPDLGPYRIPCPSPVPHGQQCNADGTLTQSGPMIPPGQNFFDGTSGSLAYDYQNNSGSGNSLSYSKTLSESEDVKIGYASQAEEPGVEVRSHLSIDLNFHNSNSWAGLKTSDSMVTSDTGITLNRSSGDSTQAYAFYPTFYTTKDGTIKVSHAVDVLGSTIGRTFWAGLYGQKADPALNLPSRFLPAYNGLNTLVGWQPNYLSSRKRMRGLFFEKAELNPVTNTYDLLASNPLAGDKVRVESRVYNYSTSNTHLVNNLKVRFQVVNYDPNSDTETPFTACPGGAILQNGRCTIGETIVPQLSPLAMTTAAVLWDTTGFGPSRPGDSSEYRVYVVLDPDNQINETYETENPNVDYPCVDGSGNACSPALPKGVDPGQNNEGFGHLIIQHQGLSATPGASFEADASMRRKALGVRDGQGRLRTNNALAEVNRPVSVRATVHSDNTHRSRSHLLVYDGEPESGGELIASKLIHTGNKRGSEIWFEWTPERLGRRRLYAKVIEASDDPNKGNNIALLDVNVVPRDTTPPRLAITLTPNALESSPDGRMVPITATISVRDDNDRQPEVRLHAITHNEASDAAPDISGAEFLTDDRSFLLRATHTGRRRDARVYEVVYSATDWAGNMTLTKAYLLVPGKK